MKKFPLARLMIFALLPLLTACGSSAKIENTFGFDKPIESAVGPAGAEMGNLETDKINLEISENALAGEQKITIEKAEKFDVPAKDSGILLSSPVKLSVDQEMKRFDAPITIRMALTDEEIKSIEKEGELWGAYYNGNEWQFIRPDAVDLENKYLEFKTWHFSLFSKGKPTSDYIINDFAETKAVEIWNNRNNNNVTNEETKSLIKDVLKNQLGIVDNPTLEEDVLAAILKEDAYINLLNDYAEGNVDAYAQNIALMAGEKIVDVISNYPETVAGEILGGVVDHASKIGTGVQMATHLANGEYTNAMKALSNEIIDSYPLTKIFKTAAEITERQIARWKDQELEAAYQAFKNGVESDVPFWGYQVEKGNFDDVWNQMKGLQTKILDDAIKDYAARKGIDYNAMGSEMLEQIRKDARENLKQEFLNRQSQEKEIEKIKAENMKLITAYEKANLLVKYRLGFTEDTDLNFRLERLFKIKDMILNDTKARITNNDLPEKGEISPATIAILTTIWYTGEDGKEQYQKKLVELGYLEEIEEASIKLEYGGVPGKPNMVPEYEYEALGLLLSPLEIKSDGTISADFNNPTKVKLIESWLTNGSSPGGEITLVAGSIKGTYDAKNQRGSGTISLSWKFTEEGGSGIEYQKYDVPRSFEGTFDLEPAYNDANKPFGQLFLTVIGQSSWTVAYTGKTYDPEKQDYYIATDTTEYSNSEYGFVVAYNVITK